MLIQEISITDWLYVVLVMLLAGWVHGALGLGFPMIATPLIAIFVDVKIAILITLLPTVAVNIASVVSADNVLPVVKKYRVLLVATLAGGIVGAIVLAHADPSPFRLLLAALIMLFILSSRFNSQMPIGSSAATMAIFGLVAGFSGGTTNVMVAVLIIYFLANGTSRIEMVAAMNCCFLIGKLSQIVIFLMTGLITIQSLLYTAPLAVVALVALFLGQRVGQSVPVDRYKRILYIVLLLLAIVLVVQYFFGL